jgi:Uma2 family endonuclease
MVTASPRKGLTYEEYVALERTSDEKHEFVAGQLFAMSGAKRAHNLITVNVSTSLSAQLRDRPCLVFSPDMRVRTRDDVGAYPDVTATCGRPEFDASEEELQNPELIVEVLSDSMERYDRGAKFEHYQTIPSFQEYVLASSSKPRLEVFTRRLDGSWLLRAYGPGEVAKLSSLGVELAVDEVYRKVFEPETP